MCGARLIFLSSSQFIFNVNISGWEQKISFVSLDKSRSQQINAFRKRQQAKLALQANKFHR